MKPYKGEISNYRIIEFVGDGNSYDPEKYGPNLGYIVQGIFHNHPVFRGLSAAGATTSLVVKRYEDGFIDTLNSRYKLIGDPE